MPGGDRWGEAGGLKPLCPGRLGRTPLQGHAGSRTRDALVSASTVPLTAAAPWAPVPDVPPLVETPPRHRFRDIGEVMAVADRALLSAQVQTLRFHIQKVRQGESGAERGCGAAGGSWAG